MRRRNRRAAFSRLWSRASCAGRAWSFSIGFRPARSARIPHSGAAKNMAEALAKYYQGPADVPELVLVPVMPQGAEVLAGGLSALRGRKTCLIVPSKGKNKELLDLSLRNAEIMMQRKRGEMAALEEVQKILGLDSPPRRIEGFDISNTGGTESVASMVSFLVGRPDKS
jgi:excinuclease ABC subunit C